MEAIKVLEDVLTKNVKITSKENKKKAVDALTALFTESNDPKQVVEYLIKLHYSVCQTFLEEFCTSASDEQITVVAEALVADEQFKKGNPNNIRHPKGLSAVLALASKEKYQPAFFVLLNILSYAEKSDGFSDGCINNFKKLIVEKNGLPFVSNLFEQMTNGTIVCKESEQRCLTRFLKIIDNMTVVTTKEEVPAVGQNSESIKTSVTEMGKINDVCFSSVVKPAAISDNIDVVYKIERTQQDILNYVRKLVENRTSIDALTLAIAQRDGELDSLRDVVSEKEQRIALLSSEFGAMDRQLSEVKGQVADLTDRLRTALQMDDISKSQELITLKNDISEALKLDYADFIKSSERPYSDSLFNVYRTTLSRIFKLLKRFGINCE